MNTDTGDYRPLGTEGLRENEVEVRGTPEQVEKLSRNVRRGLRHTDQGKTLEERVAELEAREHERQRQVGLRARASHVGLILP